jgi:hypothetical protein
MKATSPVGQHALRHGRGLGRVAAGVGMHGFQAPAQHAAALVDFLDRHGDAALLVLAAGRVLAGVVGGQADHQGLFAPGLGPGAVQRPRAEKAHGRRAGPAHQLPPPAAGPRAGGFAIGNHDGNARVQTS